jgi:catechol 2,3-dioxygenase-like lactoylglutathione lyase family enzyme
MRLEPHHVGINVNDLERSMAFYEKLGFERTRIIPSEPGLTIAFMRLGALSIELFAYAEATAAPAREDHSLGFRHLALRTDDIETTVAELQAAGAVRRDAAIRSLPNGMRLVFFPDPDGVEIEILQEA